MTLLCRSRTAAASACRRRFSSGSRTIEVISPRDGKPFATLQDWSAADVDAAVTRGRRHLASSWASRGAVDGRCDVLRRMGAALRERLEEFSQLETLDCGKPIAESRVDIETCAALFDYYAELAPGVLLDEPLAVPDDAFASRVVPHPVGLVGAVTPWNYPLMQAVVKVAPALATGCAVLLKPSPLASLTCEKLGELGAQAGLPEGALAVVTGGPPGGAADGAAALVQHPQLVRAPPLARALALARTRSKTIPPPTRRHQLLIDRPRAASPRARPLARRTTCPSPAPARRGARCCTRAPRRCGPPRSSWAARAR